MVNFGGVSCDHIKGHLPPLGGPPHGSRFETCGKPIPQLAVSSPSGENGDLLPCRCIFTQSTVIYKIVSCKNWIDKWRYYLFILSVINLFILHLRTSNNISAANAQRYIKSTNLSKPVTFVIMK